MNLAKAHKILLSSSLSVFLVGCSSAPNYSQSEMHLTVEEVSSEQQIKPKNIPSLVKASPTASALSKVEESDTFDVTVVGAPVRDLLFVLARDAGVNMDIDDKVGGFVSINALDQTLDAILARISEQVAIRVDYVGDAIVIKADTPYYKQYHMDYLAIDREYSSSIDSEGVGGGETTLENTVNVSFWDSIEDAIGSIVGSVEVNESGDSSIVVGSGGSQEEKQIGAGIADAELSLAGTSFFNINRDLGVLLVYAPSTVHAEVEKYLDAASVISKRQVLLEATVVEVILNNQYAQGIDWSLFNSLAEEGLGLYQGGLAGGAAAALNTITREFERTITGNAFSSQAAAQTFIDAQVSSYERNNRTSLVSVESEIEAVTVNGVTTYTPTIDLTTEEFNREATIRNGGGIAPVRSNSNNFFSAAYRAGDLSAAVQLLDQFGDSKVLSSPRISALNNQPAILKVVDQEVYFNYNVEDEVNEVTGQVTSRSFEVEENVVDVGFVLNVLPNISANGEIMLNLKPTVTRIIDYRSVPELRLPGTTGASGNGQNVVPITRVRELESLISLRDGEVAVLGGLLEDRTTDNSTGVPGLNSLPGVGALFENKNQTTFKTEFVVFLRAKIIKNPSINGDYSDFRDLLPNSDFIIRDTGDALLVPDQENAR